jgi:hypothetical protein
MAGEVNRISPYAATNLEDVFAAPARKSRKILNVRLDEILATLNTL